MKNFKFYFFLGGGERCSLENLIFMGREVPEKPLYRGVLPKRGRLGQFPNLRGGEAWQKRGKWYF